MNIYQRLAEQRERWERGDLVPVEAFVGAEVLSESDLLDLVYQEIILREVYGEPPKEAEYVSRFPDLAAELRMHFDVHHALRDVELEPEPLPDVPGFELSERLGQGGMGVVFKARQKSLDRLVALKFLPRTMALDDEALARFRREARTASSLNHPHICTIYDLGQHERGPFIVMELVDGQSLASLRKTVPPMERVREIIRQVVEALSAAHAAGIVHRDVKPENVMVRSDGWVKVVDFGLARLVSPERLDLHGPTATATADGAVLGTLRYMAPEQLGGGAASAPSDVFALGLVWYELATGRHPFAAGSAISMLSSEPETIMLPSELVAVPPTWDAIIMRMLALDAAARPTLPEVLSALSAAAAPSPATRPMRVAPTFVGRERPMGELWDAFTAAQDGGVTLVAVRGEAGLGKSALVDQMVSALGETHRARWIARARCSERLAGTGAYLPILEALGGLLRGEQGSAVAKIMTQHAPSWYSQCVPSANISQGSSQERRQRELAAFFVELAARGPIVLTLDDVQWADLSTVELLAYLGRWRDEMPLLVVVAYRPSDLQLAKHPWLGIEQELEARGTCRVLTLHPLGREDVATYLAAVLKHTTPALVDKAFARTEGNPLFLAELAREPDLDRELPESVKSLVQRQIARLSESDQRLLSAAAVAGHEFESAVVARASKLDPEDVEDRLAELERVHALVRSLREHELPDGTPSVRCAFGHKLFHAALYGTLQPTRRASLSRAVAEAMLAHHGNALAPVETDIAMLLESARDHERALLHFRAAASRALHVFAYHEAAQLVKKALALLPRLADRDAAAKAELAMSLQLAVALRSVRGFADPEVAALMARARELARAARDGAEGAFALWTISIFHLNRGDVPAAIDLMREMKTRAEATGDPVLIAAARSLQGVLHLHAGETTDAHDAIQAARALVDAALAPAFQKRFGVPPRVLFDAQLAWVLAYSARIEEAVALAEATLLAARGAGSQAELQALFVAGLVAQVAGDAPKTLEHCDDVTRINRDLKRPFYGSLALAFGGWARAATGVLDAAEAGLAAIDHALITMRSHGTRTIEPHIMTLRAEVLERLGRRDDARAELAAAKALAEATGERYHEPEMERLARALSDP